MVGETVRRSIHRRGNVALLLATMGSVVLGAAQSHVSWLLPPGLPTAQAAEAPPPAVGQKAPEIRLGDQHGKTFVLADAIRDRKFVVVAFYPKAFSGG